VAAIRSANMGFYLLPLKDAPWDVYPVAAQFRVLLDGQILGKPLPIESQGVHGLYPDDVYDIIVSEPRKDGSTPDAATTSPAAESSLQAELQTARPPTKGPESSRPTGLTRANPACPGGQRGSEQLTACLAAVPAGSYRFAVGFFRDRQAPQPDVRLALQAVTRDNWHPWQRWALGNGVSVFPSRGNSGRSPVVTTQARQTRRKKLI